MKRIICFVTGETFLKLIQMLPLACSFKAIGLPDDARFISVYADHGRQRIGVIVESESFAAVYPGDEIPWFDATIEVIP